jgi:hypothetical protein
MKKIFDIDENDFVNAIGRQPKDDKELDAFCRLICEGINAQVNWEILYKCAKDEMKEIKKQRRMGELNGK